MTVIDYQKFVQDEIQSYGREPGTSRLPIIERYIDIDIPFRPTDLFNVQLFETIGKGKILFMYEHGIWYSWSGKVWGEDKNRTEPECVAQEVIRHIYALASGAGTEDERKLIVKWAMESESEPRRKAMISGAERSQVFEYHVSTFDRDDYLFNCQNGVLDLKTGELLDHDPEYFMTKISPCNYDPEATSELWDDTINRALQGDSEVISFLHRYCGLCLTGDVNQKIFTFLYGNKGHNGKSTIVQTLLYVMGGYGTKISVNTLMSGARRQPGSASPDIAKMEGRRLVVTSETEKDIAFNDQIVKDLTGRDSIPARRLYKDDYDFYPKMKIMIYGNNKPTLRGNSQAMRNRMRLIVFDYIFKGEGDDRKAQDRLRNEHGDAVLNWMIKGYQDFCKHGLPEPEKIRVATDDYFHEFDKLRGYFDENFIPDDEGEIVFSELYDEVTDFLGWKMSKRKFSETLKHDLEIEVVAGRGNVRVIRGWRKPGLHDIRDEDGTFIPF